MPLLRLSGATVSRGGRDLFSSATFSLEEGFTGVVGENGAGKSTLLEVLFGSHPLDEGARTLLPGDARLVLVPQSCDAPVRRSDGTGDLARELRLGTGERAALLRARFGLAAAARAGSPGERRRWQIAAALAAEPDVLLLDEPTNHLDAEGLAAALEELGRFAGACVIVSHERSVLDALSSRTLFLERGRIELRPGCHRDARRALDVEREACRAERERRTKKARALHGAVSRKRATRAAAESSRSAKKRMKSRDDRDARSLGARFRADRAEASLGRDVAALAARAERARADVEALPLDDAHLGSIALPSRADAPPFLYRVEVPPLGGFLAGRRVDLPRGARVHLSGPNGAGKTTLLRHLVERWSHARERLFVLPQELDPDRPREAFRALPPDARGRVLSLVARLGSDPRAILASPRLSPGEARKLAIAVAILEPTWLLVLDEPTNHLDLPSRERLEAALRVYDGAIVLTSHDARFAEAVADTRWTLP